ncbi:MAG: 6,7-dimethyl-8-ribityllumazine synthase [Armatimonadetes bacterium]|nr:6,7-dimethyl-8-ribityllumazine synthase [Armatimonadota bacterium]
MGEYSGRLNASGRRFAIVVSRFNSMISDRLLAGAKDTLIRHGAGEGDIAVYRVPGAWELPVVAQQLAGSGKWDAIIALGCLIRGETPHFDYIAAEVTRALGEIARTTGRPVAYGLLTTESMDQAVARAGGKAGNKGVEAAIAAIEMVDLLADLDKGF